MLNLAIALADRVEIWFREFHSHGWLSSLFAVDKTAIDVCACTSVWRFCSWCPRATGSPGRTAAVIRITSVATETVALNGRGGRCV